MDDVESHTLQLPWRSLEDLQKIAIDGKRGKTAGDLNPFTKLRVNELSEELNSRSVTTTGMRKDQMKDILKGRSPPCTYPTTPQSYLYTQGHQPTGILNLGLLASPLFEGSLDQPLQAAAISAKRQCQKVHPFSNSD